MLMTFVLAVGVFGVGGLPFGEGEGWRYVVPGVGDSFEHAPFRAIVLSREKPAELVEKVGYRGEAEAGGMRCYGLGVQARHG